MLVGIGMGIGFGALIFHPFNTNSLGGGIWFGKKRKKRQTKGGKKNKFVSFIEPMDHEKISILERINQAEKLFKDE